MGLFGLISRMSHVMSHGICDATARAHIHMAHHHIIPDISGIILRMTWLIRDMSPKRPIFYQKRHIFYQKRPIFYQHDVWHDSRHGASCHTWYFRTHITYDMTGTAHAHIHMAHGSSRTWRDVTHACVCVCVCVCHDVTWRDMRPHPHDAHYLWHDPHSYLATVHGTSAHILSDEIEIWYNLILYWKNRVSRFGGVQECRIFSGIFHMRSEWRPQIVICVLFWWNIGLFC